MIVHSQRQILTTAYIPYNNNSTSPSTSATQLKSFLTQLNARIHCKLKSVQPSRMTRMLLSLTTMVLLLATTTALSLSANSRRDFFVSSIVTVGGALAQKPAFAIDEKEGGVILFTLPSGLKYIDILEGTGPSPRYGQLCGIKYTAYLKLPNSEKEKYDSNEFLLKHGNGRMIAGLDEGLHTMKMGGSRRIIIPPKLGFVEGDLGPIPMYPWDRYKLSGLLDKMIEVRAGNLIYDVELVSVIDDEADQGYYDDSSLTPEQFSQLRDSIQQRAQKALSVQPEVVSDA